MASNVNSARPTTPAHICIEINDHGSGAAETTVSKQGHKNPLLTNVVENSSVSSQISLPADLNTHTPPTEHPTPPQMKKDASDFNASRLFVDEDVVDKLLPCKLCDLPQAEHKRKPYHNYVKSLITSDFAEMVQLDEFMNYHFHANHPENTKWSHSYFRSAWKKFYPAYVTVMEFQAPTATLEEMEFPNFELQKGARIIDIGEDINNLQKYLALCEFKVGFDAHGPPKDSEPLRLILVEDLTPDLIEVLGMSLSIPASFFAAHLAPLDDLVQDIDLPSVTALRSYVNFNIQKVSYITANNYGHSINDAANEINFPYPTNCRRNNVTLRLMKQDMYYDLGFGIWRSGGDVQHRGIRFQTSQVPHSPLPAPISHCTLPSYSPKNYPSSCPKFCHVTFCWLLNN